MMRMTLALLLGVSLAVAADPASPPPAPNGLTRPSGFLNWRLIGVSQRTDNNSLRAILGNDIAIQAARSGQTAPWPEGTVLAKLVWKQTDHALFPAAHVPDALLHAEFMVKDTGRYAATGGWGFGRWLGTDQRPYGKDADFAAECFGCHAQAKSTDWVFTRPVQLPP